MKTFEYRGFDQVGQVVSGLVEAFDLKEAREKLAGQGVLAERVSQAGARRARQLFRRRTSLAADTRAMLYREVSALLKAGLPLAHALEVLIEAPELGENRAWLAGVRDRIREGSALAVALGEASHDVTPFETAAVEVGERSGTLAEALQRVASFMEDQQRLRERVQTALIYPAIVVIAALVVATLILGVMVPRFARLLIEARVELPVLTQGVLTASRVLLVSGGPILILLVLAALLVRRRMAKDVAFREAADRQCFRLPVWGGAYTALVNLRFARTLSLLLRGGVPLIDGIVLAGRATGSAWVSGLLDKEADSVRHGDTLADAIRRVPPLGASLPGWIQAGEASGDLEGLLENASARYERQWDRVMARAVIVLEPILILLVGGLVLVLALAILLPVLSLNKALL